MTLKCPMFAFSFKTDLACPALDCVYRTKNDSSAISSCAKLSMPDDGILFDAIPFPVLEAFAQSKSLANQRATSLQLLSLVLRVMYILSSESMSDYNSDNICKCGLYLEGCEGSKADNKCQKRIVWIDWVIDYILNGVNGHAFSRYSKNVMRKVVLDVVTLQKQEIGNPPLIAHLYKSTRMKKDKSDAQG